jgi:hypothetical protein
MSIFIILNLVWMQHSMTIVTVVIFRIDVHYTIPLKSLHLFVGFYYRKAHILMYFKAVHAQIKIWFSRISMQCLVTSELHNWTSN